MGSDKLDKSDPGIHRCSQLVMAFTYSKSGMETRLSTAGSQLGLAWPILKYACQARGNTQAYRHSY